MFARRRLAGGILACLAVATSGVPAQRTGAPQRPPVIRTGITMVPIDVRVLDRNGQPITDLEQRDFTILENGDAQTIRHFSSQAFTADRSAIRDQPAFRTAATPDVAPQNRRVFLMMLGRGRHQSVSKYVDALAEFIAHRVNPQDQVAVLAWNRATDFTTNHGLIRQTVLRLRDRHAGIQTNLEEWFSGLRAIYGSKEIPPHIQRQIDDVFAEARALRPRPVPPASPSDSGQINADVRRTTENLLRNQEITEKLAAGGSSVRDIQAEAAAELFDGDFMAYAEQMTEAMHDLTTLYAGIAYLRHLEGEKHLVFITEKGVSLPRQDSNVTLARAASDARIALDIIHTGGVVGPARPQFVTGGGIKVSPWATPNQTFQQTFAVQDLRLMADLTGGEMMAFKTGADAFRRLGDAVAFQYLLGYYPSDAARDGRFRTVTVKVNRPGARVLHRRGYFAADRLVPLDRRQFVTFSRIEAAGAFSGPVDHLKVTLGKPIAGERELSVDVTVDISRVHFTREGERHIASLDVALYCGDGKQVVVGEATHRVDLKLTDALHARMLREGTSFRVSAPLRAPAVAVKVVVYDYGADVVGTAVAPVKR